MGNEHFHLGYCDFRDGIQMESGGVHDNPRPGRGIVIRSRVTVTPLPHGDKGFGSISTSAMFDG